MSKRKSNVIRMKTNSDSLTDEQKLRLAQEKADTAWERKGKQRIKLAREALALSRDCADAYTLLAEEEEEPDEQIRLFREALAAAERVIGQNWMKDFKGLFWVAPETRPVMIAMSNLAKCLQEYNEFDEALALFRKLIELNPNDNQGIRYLLANCLFDAHCDDELEKLLAKHDNDPSAALLYTKAVHLFRKEGPSQRAADALNRAFNENIHVPSLVSDIFEMPDEPPDSIGFGDMSEAVAYYFDSAHFWWFTKGSMKWMAATLEPAMREAIDDSELVDDVIAALKNDLNDNNDPN